MPGAGGTGGGACGARGDINKPSYAPRRPGQPGPPSPPATLAPRAPGSELQGSRSMPRAGHCLPPCPPPGLPSSPPASGPAARAASSGAHYRVAGGVGPARLRALVPRRRVPARPLHSPPPPPERRPSLPARLPALLAGSLPPIPVALPLSASSAGSPPPTPFFSPPSSFPPSGRRPAQASPPVAALAPGAAEPTREAAPTGVPGATRRERPGCAASPSAHIRLPGLCSPAGGPRTLRDGLDPAAPRPCAGPGHPASAALRATPPGALLQPSPRGALHYLALPLRWVPASSTGRRDSGPSSPRAGVKCLPPGSPPSPRRPSPCSSPDLHQSPLHSACLSTGAGDSSASPSAPQLPPHPPGATAQWRPAHSIGPRSGRQAHPGRPGGSRASTG